MKTKILLAVLVMNFHQIFAHPFLSAFHLRAANNTPILVSIDGYNASEANSQVILRDLQPGRHFIKVMEWNRTSLGYPFINVIYKGTINIQAGTKTFATIDNYRGLRIENVVACNHNDDYYYNELENDPSTHCMPKHPRQEPNSRPRCGTDYMQPSKAMNPYNFEQFRNNIAQQTFESTKLNVLKQVASSNYFTTYQVKDLVSLFTFESNRLEVAKSMYDHTLDKQNYYQVNSTFTFSSSVDDLTQYLAIR